MPTHAKGRGKPENSLRQLKDDIEDFLSRYLPPTLDPQHSSAKVVHDGLWGTLRLSEPEIAFIETPLVQRLRHIHQMGFSYLTLWV